MSIYDQSIEDTVAALNARMPASQAQSLPPLTCRHANRSDCALYEPNRPAKEWYEQKIKETDGLDSALPSGALAGNQLQPAPQGVAEVPGTHDAFEMLDALQGAYLNWGGWSGTTVMLGKLKTAIITERDALRAQIDEQSATIKRLSLYENLANEYGLSAFPDMAALQARVTELEQDAARYRWLRDRPGQIGMSLWPHAPWTHEGLEENQARFELCIDEERVEVIDAAIAAAKEPK